MTSFAFILGVLPLVLASGPGWELRQALGTAVFFGMIGVTAFGLIFTPVFYVACRALGERLRPAAAGPPRSPIRAAAGRMRNNMMQLKQPHHHRLGARAGRACAVGPNYARARHAVSGRRTVRRGQRTGRPAARAGRSQLVAALRRSGPRRAGRRCARRQHGYPRRRCPPGQGPRRAARSEGRPLARRRRRRRSDPRTRRRRHPHASTSFDAGLDVAYEVDLFGRVSRNIEAARGDLSAAEADADAVRVAIVAETARAYADAASAAERLAVATADRRLARPIAQSHQPPGRGRADHAARHRPHRRAAPPATGRNSGDRRRA